MAKLKSGVVYRLLYCAARQGGDNRQLRELIGFEAMDF